MVNQQANSMSDSDEDYYNLRSRRVEKHNRIHIGRTSTSQAQTSTPVRSSPPQLRAQELIRTIRKSTQYFRELSNQVDQNISVQHCTTLFPNLANSSVNLTMVNPPAMIYNKEIAELMTNNIPKFELNSSANPALELRSFIKSCENVLNLFTEDNVAAHAEFFKLIKFRLGYDVLERITVDKFETIAELETHLRSICHLKLNKGRLLSEIRHERQLSDEDVSHFVERLRKLIAQGRSEYPNDKEFEREAIHTLKNSVKNELISIKLMDSASNKFEELAEIAINRDSELHQRSYSITKSDSNVSPDVINELVQKIKNLEAKQTASIQHIREEPRLRTKSPNRYGNVPFRPPSRARSYCNYCKRPGHNINECRSRNRNQNYQRNGFNQNYTQPRNFEGPNYTQNRQYQSREYQEPDYNNNPRTFSRNYSNNQPRNYNSRSSSPEARNYNYTNNINSGNIPITCIRCNQNGHKSNNCYELICSVCKQFGHIHSQCQQSTTHRRVHFLNSGNCEESSPIDNNQRQSCSSQCSQRSNPGNA